jgi:hypothetical protein
LPAELRFDSLLGPGVLAVLVRLVRVVRRGRNIASRRIVLCALVYNRGVQDILLNCRGRVWVPSLVHQVERFCGSRLDHNVVRVFTHVQAGGTPLLGVYGKEMEILLLQRRPDLMASTVLGRLLGRVPSNFRCSPTRGPP